MRKEYYKLVRDAIPDIIRDRGQTCEVNVSKGERVRGRDKSGPYGRVITSLDFHLPSMPGFAILHAMQKKLRIEGY